MKAHPDGRNSFRQPAVYGTLEASGIFQRARHRLDDERRFTLGAGHKILAIGEGKMEMAERVGFEPTVEFPQHTLSKRAP